MFLILGTLSSDCNTKSHIENQIKVNWYQSWLCASLILYFISIEISKEQILLIKQWTSSILVDYANASEFF